MDLKLPARPAPKIELWPYQRKLVEELRIAFREDRNPCLALATGGGKTVIAAGLAASSQDKDRNIWFLCHRDFLVSQTSATFDLMGVDHSILSAAHAHRGWANTMVVAIDTLRSRLSKIDRRPDVIFWDECHHVPAASWRKVWEWAGEDCFHIGATATPIRLDGRGLAPSGPGEPGFEKLILGPTTADLMGWGFLSTYRAFAPSRIDLRGVGQRAGDYDRGQLKKAVTAQVITGDVVGHYQRLAPGKKFVYFCVSVEYSKHLAEAFTAAGFPARHLDARDDSATRAQAARDIATGKLCVITNVGLFGEGYDLAAQAGMPVTIEGVGLVRPTMSESLAIQQMGRCLRKKSYPGIIIDHAGVIMTHGLPDTDRDWSLLGRQKKKTVAQTKVCPGCFAVVPSSTATCPHCGHRWLAKVPRVVSHAEGELVEIDAATFNERRRSWSQVVGNCKSYSDFVKAAAFLGYKPGWAHYAWKEFLANGFVRRRGQF